MNREQLDEILAGHALWLEDPSKARRANLAGANLAGADLRRVDLRWANLTDANVAKATLYMANLHGANLHGANLGWANLCWANLAGANLTDATLYRANLRRANLTGANLTEADLRWSDLRCADLIKANLTNATLYMANLTDAAGVTWAATGPAGKGRRTLTGVIQPWTTDLPQLVIHGGCAHLTPDGYRQLMASDVLPWGWTIGDLKAGRVDVWRQEILAAVDYIEQTIKGHTS